MQYISILSIYICIVFLLLEKQDGGQNIICINHANKKISRKDPPKPTKLLFGLSLGISKTAGKLTFRKMIIVNNWLRIRKHSDCVV